MTMKSLIIMIPVLIINVGLVSIFASRVFSAIADRPQPKQYNGYKVVRTQQLNTTNANILRNLQIHIENLDFWQDPMEGRLADICISPQNLPKLKSLLQYYGIQFSIMIDDLEKLHQLNKRPPTLANYDWKDYHSHNAINSFIDNLAATNAGWVSTTSIGTTHEGRDMRVIKIEKAGAKAPIVWIEAGIHAREWISSATTTFMINELVNKYEENKEIVDNLRLHFLPMANPDGYEYSRSVVRYN